MNIFPREVCDCLYIYIANPKASSCTDTKLLKALKKFDISNEYVHLDDVPEKSIFKSFIDAKITILLFGNIRGLWFVLPYR